MDNFHLLKHKTLHQYFDEKDLNYKSALNSLSLDSMRIFFRLPT